MPLGGGVDEIGEVHFRDAPDIFEQEGDEGGLVGFGHLGEHLAKVAGERLAHIGGHLHAGEDDPDLGMAGAGFLNDGLEIGACGGWGNAAEPVIAAEFEDENIDGPFEKPIDAAETAGSGITADAGIDEGERERKRIDAFLEQRGETLGRVEAVGGGEAVAEEDDGEVGGGFGGCGGGKAGPRGRRRFCGGEGQAGVEQQRRESECREQKNPGPEQNGSEGGPKPARHGLRLA